MAATTLIAVNEAVGGDLFSLVIMVFPIRLSSEEPGY